MIVLRFKTFTENFVICCNQITNSFCRKCDSSWNVHEYQVQEIFPLHQERLKHNIAGETINPKLLNHKRQHNASWSTPFVVDGWNPNPQQAALRSHLKFPHNIDHLHQTLSHQVSRKFQCGRIPSVTPRKGDLTGDTIEPDADKLHCVLAGLGRCLLLQTGWSIPWSTLYFVNGTTPVPAPKKVAEMREVRCESEAECSSLARHLTTVTTADPARCVDVSETELLRSSTRLRMEHLHRIGQRFHLLHKTLHFWTQLLLLAACDSTEVDKLFSWIPPRPLSISKPCSVLQTCPQETAGRLQNCEQRFTRHGECRRARSGFCPRNQWAHPQCWSCGFLHATTTGADNSSSSSLLDDRLCKERHHYCLLTQKEENCRIDNSSDKSHHVDHVLHVDLSMPNFCVLPRAHPGTCTGNSTKIVTSTRNDPTTPTCGRTVSHGWTKRRALLLHPKLPPTHPEPYGRRENMYSRTPATHTRAPCSTRTEQCKKHAAWNTFFTYCCFLCGCLHCLKQRKNVHLVEMLQWSVSLSCNMMIFR